MKDWKGFMPADMVYDIPYCYYSSYVQVCYGLRDKGPLGVGNGFRINDTVRRSIRPPGRCVERPHFIT